MAKDAVTLLLAGGSAAKVSVASFTKGEWSKCQPVAQKTKTELDLTSCGPLASAAFAKLDVKGEVVKELRVLYEQYAHVEGGLRIFTKPKVEVVAKTWFGAQKLVLVPATLRVECDVAGPGGRRGGGAKVPMGALDLGVLLKTGGKAIRFFLNPTRTFPQEDEPGYVCPFWLVQGSSDAKSDLINMELTEDLSDYERKGRSKQIKIPFLRNTRPIKDGETLVVFRKKEERPTVPEPIVKIEDDDEDV